MKIRFNHVISAIVFVIFVLTSANGIYVPQNPVANNQSSPAKPSARMSSNKIHLPVSHIEAEEKSATFTTTETIVVTSTASNTSAVTFTSIDTLATTTFKVSEPAKNTTSTTPMNGTANYPTAMTFIEGTASTQALTMTSVGTATETQTDENGFLTDKYVIRPPGHEAKVVKCPKGYTMTSTGDCAPSFYGH